MDTTHTARNINVSIRKVRALIPAVLKLSPVDALARLTYTQSSAGRALADAVKTALANAQNTLKVSRDVLEFRRLSADQGMVMKRFRAGSRGTAQPILRRMTHITVVLRAKAPVSISEPTSKPQLQKEVKKDESSEMKKEVKTKKTPSKKTSTPKTSRVTKASRAKKSTS